MAYPLLRFSPTRLIEAGIMKLSGMSLSPLEEEIGLAPESDDSPLAPEPAARLPSMPKAKRLRSLRRYPYDLDHCLLHFSRRDAFSLGELLEGVHIFGNPGSGKSSGSGDTIALAALKAGLGFVVTTHKSDERTRWKRLCKQAGRSRDLVILHPDNPYRCNLLEYTLMRAGEGAGHVENAVDVFITLTETRNQGAQRADPHWVNASRRHLRFCLEALANGGILLTMDNIEHVMQGLPFFWDGNIHYPEGSLLKRCLDAADKNAKRSKKLLVSPARVRAYFEREWAINGAERQNAGVITTLQTILDPLQSQLIQDLLFSPTPNFDPGAARRGAVVLLDLPVLEWQAMGRMAQIMFRYIAQHAVMRRQGLPPGETPVLFWSDEAQTFLTPLDREFAEASRSSWGSSVNLVQNINSIFAKMDVGMYDPQAKALLANFGTVICHRNGDSATNTWAAEMIGKDSVIRRSGSRSQSGTQQLGFNLNEGSARSISGGQNGGSYSVSSNTGWGANRSRSETWSASTGYQETYDYLVPPRIFTLLRSGGRANNKQVDGIVFKAGKIWNGTQQPFLGVTFRQP